MTKPILSIITVVFNAHTTIEHTLRSVISQKNDSVEYWLIDGGSTDGTLDVIRQYASQLTGYISEPDRGIYDAMNKGIDRCNGEWVYFLGADDRLADGALESIIPHLKPPYQLIYGNTLFDNGHLMKSSLGSRTLAQNTVHHQSAFYNRALFETFQYDTTLKIISDYELNLRVYVFSVPAEYIPITVAICATGGASSNLNESLKETNLIRARYIKNPFKNKLITLALNLYYTQKKIRHYLYGHQV
ncbi:glycosyltransferase family 2 protein [Spirosoma luteolum]